MLSSDTVWSRAESGEPDQISAQMYNLTIGLTLLWGFGVNYYMIKTISVEQVMAIGFLPLIIGYFVSCFFGIYLYTSSDSPVVSFIGYNFVVVPIGIILVPFISAYDPLVIEKALYATGAVTSTMMMLGGIYPKFFLSIGRVLFLSLVLAIVAELVMLFMNIHQPALLDWAVAVIFCGYIGFDWARANTLPKTYDNAVDSAASLYLDIINLFIRLVRILGKR